MTKIKGLGGAARISMLVALVACGGGGDGGGSGGAGGSAGSMAKNQPPGQPATETNAAPVPCADDSQCPSGIACVFPEPGQSGFCDVSEMGAGGASGADSGMPVSSAAPAPCTTDADCGPEIACKHLEGQAGPGFCDVDEMIAPGDGVAASGG